MVNLKWWDAGRRACAWATLLSLVATLVAPLPLLAQVELAGRPIQEIEYRGLRDYEAETMNYYLGLEVGKAYDPQALDRGVRSLWDKQTIDNVEVIAEPVEGGVKLIITIVERPVLESIDYSGLDKVKRHEISDQADKERIDLIEGAPLNYGELVRLEKVIRELYAQRGFRFAEVTIELEPEGNRRRVLVFVDEGDKVKIGRVEFEGNEVYSAGRLRDVMEKTRKSNLLTKLRKRDIYNPATVEEDLEKIRDLYRRFGYKDVQTGEPVIEVVARGGDDAAPDNRNRKLRIIIPIEEGPRWRLGEVRFEGNEVLEDALLARVFEPPKGGWLRADVIDDGLEKIREFYNNTGYIYAQVQPEVVEREELVADIVVHIDESDQFTIGRIEFSGNDRTRDKVLRRELLVQEGMVFNSGRLRNSLLKVNQLEFFKLNEDEMVDVETDVEDKQVNLVIQGQEAERTELQFGAGYSELDGFFGQAAVRTRNFLGRGETLGVSYQSGRYRDNIDVSYFVPWLFDRPQSLGVQFFKRGIDFDLLPSQRLLQNETGGVLTYGRSFRVFESLSLSYTNSAIEAEQEIPVLDSENPALLELDYKKSALALAYRYDSHDSRLEPTRGKRLLGQVEYAGGPLGGETYFVNPRLNLTYTRPVNIAALRTVVRLNADLQYVTPFGTDEDGAPRELLYYDRLWLGGESTVRGYNFRSIWVRDLETGAIIPDPNAGGQLVPQYGDKSVQFNFEYHFLAGGPFRVVPFIDAGNVFGDDQDVELDKLRFVAGIELRINVPLFGAPLRFIWANQLNPYGELPVGQEERFDNFDFSIGVSF